MKVAPGIVVQIQQQVASKRKGELDPALLSILQQLAKELNVGIEVRSGGQAVEAGMESYFTQSQIQKYKEYKRTGSNRHDAGMAADVVVYAPGIGTLRDGILNDNDPAKDSEELKLLQKFVALGKSKGLKGFGSGPGYMDGKGGILSTFHVDIVGDKFPGGALMWGKDSKSANAPDWMKDAYNNPQKFMKIDVEGSTEANIYKPEDTSLGQGGPAPYRHKNPAGAYPDGYATKFGSSSGSTIGGGHPIATFDTFEQGYGSNIYKFFDSDNFVGLTFYAAWAKWSGNDARGTLEKAKPYVDGLGKADGGAYPPIPVSGSTTVQKSMIHNKALVKAMFNNATRIETGSHQHTVAMMKHFEGGYKLALQKAAGDPLEMPSTSGGPGTQPSTFQSSDTSRTSSRGRQESNRSVSTGDNLRSFATRQFINLAPDQALAQIEGALGPGLSVLAPDVMSSIQTGSGIQSLKDLVSGLSSQDTVTGRISALGAFASENMALTRAVAPEAEALLPTLPLITEILEASPRDRARLVLENKDALSELLQVEIPSSIANPLTGQDINLLEAMDPEGELVTFLENFVSGVDEARAKRDAIRTSSYNDKDGLNVPVQEKKGILGSALGMVGNLFGDDTKEEIKDLIPILDEDFIPGESQYDPAVAVLELLKSDDPQKQKEALEFLRSTFPDMIPEEVNLLAATPKEFLELPEVKSKLGDAYNLLNPEETSTKRDIESYIADFISEKTEGSISVAGAKTLAFGGGEKAAKKLQSEVGSVAFEGLIESFPILGQIIEFFIQNQGLLTILGTAGAAAGLSGLAGGGLVGSALAGAGVMATARLALGEEGYNEFRGIVRAGAKPAIDIFRKAFEESGLADMEIIGPAIKGILGFAEENPEATLLGATGNVGAALGSFMATQGIELKDNPGALDDMITRMEEVNYNVPSYEALTQTIANSDGGNRNRRPLINSNERKEGDTGPASKEIARVTGGMFESRAWANVDTDGGYGWPHNTINS